MASSETTSAATSHEKSLEDLKRRFANATPLLIGGVQMVLELGELSDYANETARKELREEPEVVAQGLLELRRLIEEDSSLNVPTDDAFLTQTLRPHKWYPESALASLKRRYQNYASYTRYTGMWIPSKLRKPIVDGLVSPLPRRSANGVRLVLMEAGKKWKPKEIPLGDLSRSFVLMVNLMALEPNTQACGIYTIIDMDGFSVGQLPYYTPSYLMASVDWIQNCIPTRLKGVHIINEPYAFQLLFALFKPLLKEKLLKRIHMHGKNREQLHRYIDPAILPERYGGQLKNADEAIGQPIYNYIYQAEKYCRLMDTYGLKKEKK